MSRPIMKELALEPCKENLDDVLELFNNEKFKDTKIFDARIKNQKFPLYMVFLAKSTTDSRNSQIPNVHYEFQSSFIVVSPYVVTTYVK